MPEPGPGVVLEPGRILLDRYRVERALDRGGMGEVFLAHDTLLHRRVALKHLRPDGPQASDRRSAIIKEARRASKVSDRHIAAIHDVIDLGDDVLLVMEFVDGQTLRERLGEPFPLETFWRLSRECVEALGAAHAKGVVHRDIKPENLMLTRAGEIKIVDFGIALRTECREGDVETDDSTSSIDVERTPAGTPRYMAPEAHYGGHIDGRTDIFSLGAVFYEMLTARHPFEGGGFQTVIEHIMNRTPEPASRLNPAVPLSLSTVIERMLARDAASRYASCEEVAAALAEARASANGADVDPAPGRERVGPRGEGSEEKTVPRPRHVLRAVAIAAVGVSAAVAVCLAIWPPPLPRNRVVALLLPTTPGGSPDFASFALGSLELLASRLQRHQDQPGFQLVPLKESRGEQLASVTDARKLLGANLALVSTFDQSGNTLTAHLELREPGRGRLIAQRVIRLPQSKPLVWSDSLYRATLGLLHLPVRRGAHLPALGVRGAGTLEFLATGIGRVQAAASEQDLARARDELETACRMEPEAALPRAWLATAELKTNQQTKDPQWLARAEASARQAIALDKKLGDGHRVLGETLNLLKRPAEALPEFRLACALDPLRDDVWVGYGRSNRLLGDRGAERAVYLAAIERRPNASRPRWWLANWEFQEGHFEAAMAAYRDMIARAPDFSRGYSSLGAMLVQIGEYGRGIDTLHRALALRASSTIYTNLGTAYFNTGHLNECVDAYNQAFQFDASNYLNWLNLGDAYYWLKGQPDQAHDAYLQAVNLGRARLLQGVESGAPPDPVVTAYLATVFPKLAQPDSARAYVARANAIDSSSVSVQYLVALTCWQLGERQRALDWLERAVSGGYPPPWLRDSPVHKEWHTEPRFMALLAHAGMAPRTTKSPENGGGR